VNTLPDLKLTVVLEMKPLQKQKRAVLSGLNIAQPVLTKALLYTKPSQLPVLVQTV